MTPIAAPMIFSPGTRSLAPPGRAELEVERVFRESTVTSSFATNPMKLLTPRSRGTSVWAYTSSFGGGLVAGDRTILDVKIGPNARCFLGTQASTKVYRNPASLPCNHVTRASVGPGGLLVFAPDPVQAFADARYSQTQEFRLEPGAGLVLLDWFTSGRSARGERWLFQSLQSRNEVFLDGRRVFLDSLLLDPEDGNVAGGHRMGRFNCSALLLLIGAPLQSAAGEVLKQIADRSIPKRGTLVSSASPVRGGAALRVAGESVEEVGRQLHHHLAFLSNLLGDDPWTRKW